MKRIIIPILVFILLIMNVFGLGVGPGKATIDYEPGKSQTIDIEVFNNDGKDFNAVILVEGNLAPYIKTSENELKFTKDDKMKRFTYTITMPDTIEKPGLHTAHIKIKAIEAAKEGEIKIQTNLAVVTKLFMFVPYPGIYAEAQIRSNNVKQGDNIEIFISVFNLGEEDLNSVNARIDIFDPDGVLANRVTTGTKAIPAKKQGELVVSMTSDGILPGDYYVNATVFYDGNEIPLHSQFSVQAFLIKLLSLGVEDYTFGEIIRFSILAQNIGNRLVEDFYSRLVLKNPKGLIVANLQSYQIDIDKQETKETYAYWDTKEIELGKYYGKLSLYYEDEMLEKDVTADLYQDRIEVEVSDITALAIQQLEHPEPTAPDQDIRIFLFAIVILLVIITAVLVIMKFAPKKKK